MFIRLIVHTKIMSFIAPQSKPHNRICSYYNPQVMLKTKTGDFASYRTQTHAGKANRPTSNRVSGTYGGNITDYVGIRSSGTADLETFKLLLGAAVSKNARSTCELAATSSPRLPSPVMVIILSDVVTVAWLNVKSAYTGSHKRYMVNCNKVIYGLPQVGRLAHDLTETILATHGYHQCTKTPCLFHHTS